MKNITYRDALNEALREEMIRDQNVFLLGEDIGIRGGTFKVTAGLYEEFGEERVKDTPISESAIVGVAIGSAMIGKRPVADISYMDFLMLCCDQIVNHANKLRFMTAGAIKLPLVIRTQSSLGRLLGAQHSQYYPIWFMHMPGIKVVTPSTPKDAKGLLKASIRDDNPVLFIEMGTLYFTRGPVPDEEYITPLGKADIKRPGRDVTVVALSSTLPLALSAADRLKQDENISIEVIDPMTLNPLDCKTILESVKKTHRLIVAEPSCKTCGVGAEIAAQVAEHALDYLDAPIMRVAAPDTPAPYSPNLQDFYIPKKEDIERAVRKIVGI
ncbi:alpha-ketoacid dehydrogenase subunit beta [[Eubacterium] cellulosolvens]